MKKLVITAFILGTLAMGFPAQPAQAEVSVQVSIGGFYNELAPYGRWVSCRYGRCWVPRRVSRRWQPYSHGRWVYTDYGWTWVSRDPWGGTPYHYGSWTYIRGYGWAWVPGTVWAPAWVTWNYSDRYVGWAPLPPSFACGESGYSGRPVVLSATQYVFVPTNRFVDTEVDSIWLPTTQNPAVFQQTRPVTSFAVSDGAFRNVGVPVAAIQSAVGSRIEPRNISVANTAPQPVTVGGGGQGRRLSIVASAREVNAAVAAGPRESAAPVPSSKAAKAPKFREAQPAQARGQAPQAAPVEQRQSKAPKFREAPPAQARGQAPRAAPMEQRQAKAPKEPKFREASPAQPEGRAQQAAPMEQRQAKAPKEPRVREAPPAQPQAAQPAPAPAAQAAPPKPEPAKEKPAKPEKEKKEKDKKEH